MGVDKKDTANKVVDELNKKGSGMSDGSYSYNDTEEMMKGINQVFDAITYFVAAVAGISLFIAGIGVMNVMYISVSERTEEIAIRRAFGAKSRRYRITILSGKCRTLCDWWYYRSAYRYLNSVWRRCANARLH